MSSAASYAVQAAALVFWSFQLAPQFYSNWRARSTAGLSHSMMLAWSAGSLFTAVGSVAGGLGALFLIQPNLFMVFSLGCWAQEYYYHHSKQRGILMGVLAFFVFTGLELLFSFLIGSGQWALFSMNLLSVIFFIVGFIPQYHQLYLAGHARGISRLFLCVDMSGAVLSVCALAIEPPVDAIAGASYMAVFALDGGILMYSFATQNRRNEDASIPLTPHVDEEVANPSSAIVPA